MQSQAATAPAVFKVTTADHKPGKVFQYLVAQLLQACCHAPDSVYAQVFSRRLC